jgi:hypothetical protein
MEFERVSGFPKELSEPAVSRKPNTGGFSFPWGPDLLERKPFSDSTRHERFERGKVLSH